MSQDQKRDLILDAAVKRFAHFGVSKTTMNEIAGDLSLSKPLLYYYFPDKKSLFAAVLDDITMQNSEVIEKKLEAYAEPVEAICVLLDNRTDFIIKYYNLLEYLRSFKPGNMPKELDVIFKKLRQRELKRITSIIENGIKQKKLTADSPVKVAELYYDFIEGYRYASLLVQPSIFPEKKQFQNILKKEKEFSIIFFKGLTT